MTQESKNPAGDVLANGVPNSNIGRVKIKVIGVGGGGSNAVSRMYRDRIPDVEYVSINTDAQALAKSQTPVRLRVGDQTAKGLGVGGDPSKGRACHEENREEIRDILQEADLVFVACGMGGGTGTGGSPVVGEIAQELGALTVGVVTKPFEFEGARRMENAVKGIEELSKVVDTLIVIPNQRLLDFSEEELTMTDSFERADDVLKQGVKAISELILVPGDINLDFADVKMVMQNAGQAWMAIGSASGADRSIRAAEKALDNPLLEVSVEGAQGVVVNITSGGDARLDEMEKAMEYIRNRIAHPDANIFFGTTTDPKLEDEIRLTIVATGFPHLGDGSVPMASTASQESLRLLLDDKTMLDTPPFLRRRLANQQVSLASKS